jgi:hypothetical protein
VPYFAMELFIKDQEKALDDELRMGSLNRPPLFMLAKVSSERLALVALFKSTGGPTGTTRLAGRSLRRTRRQVLTALPACKSSMGRAG